MPYWVTHVSQSKKEKRKKKQKTKAKKKNPQKQQQKIKTKKPDFFLIDVSLAYTRSCLKRRGRDEVKEGQTRCYKVEVKEGIKPGV